MDILPFDVDKQKADLILRTIFETIRKGLENDGIVTIQDLGRFYTRKKPSRTYSNNIRKNGKFITIGRKRVPARNKVFFRGCQSLRKSMWEENGDSGSSKGT